jgi:hypothetical protein
MKSVPRACAAALSALAVFGVASSCSDSTSPATRIDGQYVLTYPVPHDEPFVRSNFVTGITDTVTFTVQAETLTVFGGRTYGQAYVTTRNDSISSSGWCCGDMTFGQGVIHFQHPNNSLPVNLDVGVHGGDRIIVLMTDRGQRLKTNFIFTRARP